MARRRRDLEAPERPDSLADARREITHLSRFHMTADSAFAERLRAELAETANYATDTFSRLDEMWAVIDRHGVRDWAERHLRHMRDLEQRRYDRRSTT